MVHEILTIALIGALISLDVTVLGQWMISRPLVSGMIIGSVLGDPWSGFKVGVIIELLWIDVIPVGVSIPLNASIVAVLASSWYILVNRYSMAAMILGICLAIQAGILFKKIDVSMRKLNVLMVHWIDACVIKGQEKRIPLFIYIGIVLSFARSFIFYIMLLYPGYLVIALLINRLPPEIMRGLHLSSEVLPLLGIIVAMKAVHLKPAELFSQYKNKVFKKQAK
ncbi:MAG: PTS sugar transporter subunit IIC [bacterium]